MTTKQPWLAERLPSLSLAELLNDVEHALGVEAVRGEGVKHKRPSRVDPAELAILVGFLERTRTRLDLLLEIAREARGQLDRGEHPSQKERTP